MNYLTILPYDLINYGYTQLDIFQKRGLCAKITDFAILLGGYINVTNKNGAYWTQTTNYKEKISCISSDGNKIFINPNNYNIGIRLAIDCSNLDINKVFSNISRASDGILEANYFNYANKAVSKELQQKLNKLYDDGLLKQVHSSIITDMARVDNFNRPFFPKPYYIYEYNNKKYIRVIANFQASPTTLSNNISYNTGDIVWVDYSPCRIWIDEKTNKAIFEDIILSGIPFNLEKCQCDFNDTIMKQFIDMYLPPLSHNLNNKKSSNNKQELIQMQQMIFDQINTYLNNMPNLTKSQKRIEFIKIHNILVKTFNEEKRKILSLYK